MIDLTTEFGRVVEKHLKFEYVIWLTTVDSRFTPQPRPVWFIWENNSILIFSQPNAYKVRHIEKHPRVSLHFNSDESGDKHVIILTGDAIIDKNCPPAQSSHCLSRKIQNRHCGSEYDARKLQRRVFDSYPNLPLQNFVVGSKIVSQPGGGFNEGYDLHASSRKETGSEY